MVPPKTPRYPYLAVADALRERLDLGEWLPGEVLPTIKELAGEYQVSRGTAARAVKVLEGEGRVTVTARWGTFAAAR